MIWLPWCFIITSVYDYLQRKRNIALSWFWIGYQAYVREFSPLLRLWINSPEFMLRHWDISLEFCCWQFITSFAKKTRTTWRFGYQCVLTFYSKSTLSSDGTYRQQIEWLYIENKENLLILLFKMDTNGHAHLSCLNLKNMIGNLKMAMIQLLNLMDRELASAKQYGDISEYSTIHELDNIARASLVHIERAQYKLSKLRRLVLANASLSKLKDFYADDTLKSSSIRISGLIASHQNNTSKGKHRQFELIEIFIFYS